MIGIKHHVSLKPGEIQIFTLEIPALECQKSPYIFFMKGII